MRCGFSIKCYFCCFMAQHAQKRALSAEGENATARLGSSCIWRNVHVARDLCKYLYLMASQLAIKCPDCSCNAARKWRSGTERMQHKLFPWPFAFWSEDLLRAGEVTGETSSLSPLLSMPALPAQSSPVENRRKTGKNTPKRPVLGL